MVSTQIRSLLICSYRMQLQVWASLGKLLKINDMESFFHIQHDVEKISQSI